MNIGEIQEQKAIVREMFVQQPANPNVAVLASPLRGSTIYSTKIKRDYSPKPAAAEFSEVADSTLPPATPVDAANLMQVFSQLQALAKQQSPRIAFKANSRILFLDLPEIVAVEAKGNYVSLQHSAKAYLLRESLSSIAGKLKSYGFIRIHRSVIVNTSVVEEIEPLSTGEYRLRVKGGKEYMVTRKYKDNLRHLAHLWIGSRTCLWPAVQDRRP